MTRCSLGWLAFYAAGVAAWTLIFALLGAAVVFGLLAFGLWLIAIAAEGLNRYPSGRDGER